MQLFSMFPPSPGLRRVNLPLPLLLLLFSCGSAETPIDADTRQTIDSIAIVRIQVARAQVDSTCRQDRVTLMPHLIDSLRKERVSEIEKQLKTIPQ
ncbi:MAG: hypothetical protein IPJ82_25170 [Lewinellaceae bacterium]|nr:hypothetical protein [Lewinellaceae bacterium]